MIYLFLFLLGLVFGSFLNVVIYRATQEESALKGRSFCPHCRTQIAWYDNIPLLSFLILRGKCRACHQPISFSYPLVELLSGLEFVWVYFLIEQNLAFFGRFEGFYSLFYLIYLLVIFYILLGITVADLKYCLVPDSLVLTGIFLSIFFVLTTYNFLLTDFKSFFLSGLGAGLFFAGLALITKNKGMGWGDVKLGVLMGLFLGWPKIIVAVYLAFLTGAGVGVILILIGRKKFGQTIPFGPFLTSSTLIAFLWGHDIWTWALKILGL